MSNYPSLAVLRGTPLENHDGILVKREDLCAAFPGPEFSKVRGIAPHLETVSAPTIGVLDTLHSKAGWAVAATCAAMGKKAIVFWPQYKQEIRQESPPRFAQQQAAAYGAELVALPAGRSAVLYHQARKELARRTEGKGYLMPNALKLPESVAANSLEVCLTAGLPPEGTLVISVSSGTVAAGVLRGFYLEGLLQTYRIILHMGYSRSEPQLRKYMYETSGRVIDWNSVTVIDEGYGYADTAPAGSSAPFPCNPHYDLKAWAWLQKNRDELSRDGSPIVFWNIGS